MAYQSTDIASRVIEILSEESEQILSPEKDISLSSDEDESAELNHEKIKKIWENAVESQMKKKAKNESQGPKAEIFSLKLNKNEEKPEKLVLCKVCKRKVANDETRFSCSTCSKFCHLACMNTAEGCPRCHELSMKASVKQMKKIEKEEQHKMEKARKEERQRLEKEEKKDKTKNEFFSQDSSPIEPAVSEAPLLNLDSLPAKFLSDVEIFFRAYPWYQESDTSLKLPINEKIIKTTPFLKELLYEKIQTLPEGDILPNHFPLLLEVWSFYCTLSELITPKSLCLDSLETFETNLKNKEIGHYLVPFLEVFYLATKKETTCLFQIIEDAKSQNTFKYLAKYFWPCLLVELVENTKFSKGEMEENEKIITKLKEFSEKRKYDIESEEEKLEILKFIMELVANSNMYRGALSEHIKEKSDEMHKLIENLQEEKLKTKEKLKETSVQINKLAEIRSNYLHNKVQDTATDVELNEAVFDEKKIKFKQNQRNLRNRLEEIKKDRATLEYIGESEYRNKVCYIGKDRKERFYWYIPQPETSDLIFVSESEENGSEKWRFYHGEEVSILINSLFSEGENESKLKNHLKTLIDLDLIRIYEDQKVSKLRQFHCNSDQAQDKENDCGILAFLKSNVKDLNISELRKILIETQRCYAESTKHLPEARKINEAYGRKIKEYKFKDVGEVIAFVEQFGSSLMTLRGENDKKARGKFKCKTHLWEGRRYHIYKLWKELIKEAKKSHELFLAALILYFEVAAMRNKKVSRLEQTKVKKSYKNQSSSKSEESEESSSSSFSDNSE